MLEEKTILSKKSLIKSLLKKTMFCEQPLNQVMQLTNMQQQTNNNNKKRTKEKGDAWMDGWMDDKSKEGQKKGWMDGGLQDGWLLPSDQKGLQLFPGKEEVGKNKTQLKSLHIIHNISAAGEYVS